MPDLHDEINILTAYFDLKNIHLREIAPDSSLSDKATNFLEIYKKYAAEGRFPPLEFGLDWAEFTRVLAKARWIIEKAKLAESKSGV